MPLLLPLTALTSALLVNLIRHRLRAQLLDVPNHRSAHTIPTPRGGGLGFLLAFLLGLPLLLWLRPDLSPWLVLQVLSVLTPLALVGFLDDRQSLPARSRYGVQLLSAGLAVAWFGPFPQPWLAPLGLVGQVIAVLLTVIGFTALVNLTNFMDGLDGFVGSISALQLTLLGLLLNQPLWLLLAAALVGFLRWNWAPAKIFMGDVGSTTLGGAVAIALMQAPSHPWALLTLTLPITADAIYTLSRRLIHGENIFAPHRTHLYQRLHQQGWTAPTITLTYLTYTLVIALLLQLGAVGPWIGVALTLGLVAVTETYLQRQREGVGSRE
jgi:UDP-N-acetylmuramyl pentapeptide phosphotransferase/UDP-N-acetylglucosamine-1-phosphate transferase